VRITSKGQVTIPQDIREAAGLLPHTEVEFVLEDGRVYVRKKRGVPARGRALVEHLRGRATVAMSTDEIMRLTRGEEEGEEGGQVT
jgi:AbrB family looped-hinge helix DNA binding protein